MSSSEQNSSLSSENETSSDESSSENVQQSSKSSSSASNTSSEMEISNSENSIKKEKQSGSSRESGEHFRNEIEIEPDLIPLKKCQTLLTAEEFNSAENEVWMMTLPSSLNAEELCNVQLSLSKSTKFKIGKEEYETVVNRRKDTAEFILPNSKGVIKMASRETVGTISIVKEVKVPKENQTTLLQTKKITEMPQGLKRRHPIYGNDLEGIILQSSGLKVPKKEITEPNEFESSNKEKKKKKKKNKH